MRTFKTNEINTHYVSKDTKAILLGLGMIALLNLLVFIPVAGFFLIFTLAPFFAGYITSKQGGRKWRNTLSVGLIWSCIQVMLFMFLLNMILPWTKIKIEGTEMSIIALMFVFNVVFSAIGCKCS